MQKSNILLVGPSGTGKTLLARTAASILNVPFAMADATGFTEAGYVGEDVDLMLYRLLESSGHNLGAAQRGIVFLDEVDKLARTTPNMLHGGKDVGGQGVQQALLKMIEGASVDVKDRRKGGAGGGAERTTIPFDTSSLLFIFSGAFNGLEEIVRDRVTRKAIGFSTSHKFTKFDKSEKPMMLNKTTPTDKSAAAESTLGSPRSIMATDLATFGLIPEFIGRIPVVARLESLDQHALERILTEPVGSLLAQYQALFAFNNCQLQFTPDAIRAIAGMAMKLEVGARGLRSILEALLQDWMYEVPKSRIQRITITSAVVEHGIRPAIEYRSESAREHSKK